jgi:AraC-like DNA-binding protein
MRASWGRPPQELVPETLEHAPDPLDLTLLRLRALGPRIDALTSDAAETGCQPHLVRYSTRQRLRLNAIVFERPWLVLIIEGQKRVGKETLRPGQLFFPPIDRPIDTVSLPDPESGVFHAMCIEILGDAQALLLRHHPDLASTISTWFSGPLRVVTPDVATLQAIEHVCDTVLSPTFHPRVLQHRLEGLLLSLVVEDEVPSHRVPAAQARADLVLAVRHLVRASPESAWSADDIARRLGLSPATLRRKLAVEGTGLRPLILQERMELARVLLRDGRLGVSEVALRCGYESPAKFSRQFARSFGHAPSASKAR